MEGEGPPFRRGFLLPPNLPHPPRTSPISPPFTKRKFVSLLESGGDIGEVFLSFGEVGICCRVRLRARLVSGYRGGRYAERHMGRFLQQCFTAAWQKMIHVSFRVFFFGGFGACQCLSSTTSIGSRRTHLPSVKSGIACGAPPCAIEASDSTETHIHAAAS